MRIIKFYSDTCGPCKVLESNLKKTDIKYDEVNIEDDDTTLVDKYKIRAVPTLIKENEGEEISRHIGVMTVDELKEWCK